MKENTNLKKKGNLNSIIKFFVKLISIIRYFIIEIFLSFIGLFYILDYFNILNPDKIQGNKLFIVSFLCTVYCFIFFLIVLFFDWLTSYFYRSSS